MIPKIIHHIVGPVLNQLVEECLESWVSLNSESFIIKKWNDDSIEDFLRNNHNFALNAFLNSRNHGEAADIARYLIIYSFGGIYCDWDVELLNSKKFLSQLKDFPNGYMLIDPQNGTLASEFFCANANDPYLINLVEDIVAIYDNNERDLYDTPHYSGPFRMRDSLIVHDNTYMATLPVKSVFAYDYSEIRNPPPGKIMQPLIHYWMHSWVN